MGFSLEIDGEQPSWPHVVCTGDANGNGRGWAWIDDPRRRVCFSVESFLGEAPVVSTALNPQPSGVQRMLAMVHIDNESPCRVAKHMRLAGIARLFRQRCPVCASNHFQAAYYLLLAASYIHPDAVKVLHGACVPEHLLRDPYVCGHGIPIDDPIEVERLLADARKKRRVKKLLRTRNHVPVWPDDPVRTKLAQIAFARQYALKYGITSPSLDEGAT